MAKRRAISTDSEDEASYSSNASKKARTEEYEEVPATVIKERGKQKDREDVVMEEQFDMTSFSVNVTKKEEEEAFEAKHGKAIEEAVRDREKRKGACILCCFF